MKNSQDWLCVFHFAKEQWWGITDQLWARLWSPLAWITSSVVSAKAVRSTGVSLGRILTPAAGEVLDQLLWMSGSSSAKWRCCFSPGGTLKAIQSVSGLRCWAEGFVSGPKWDYFPHLPPLLYNLTWTLLLLSPETAGRGPWVYEELHQGLLNLYEYDS